jgi:ketosteroid isomerase-like protein
MQEDANCAVIRRKLKAIVDHDFDTLRATMAPDVVQYYQRPTSRRDDGGTDNDRLIGRELIIEEIRDNFYTRLYQRGTVKVSIERFVSANDWVAAQFSLSAKTVLKNEDYENFYFFLYHFKDGQIVEYWEHVDSAYANMKLFA